jgi:acyl-coenzyme A thioesterase PaaI-like protein
MERRARHARRLGGGRGAMRPEPQELPVVPGCDTCFGCGPHSSPFGLHPRFVRENATVVAEFRAASHHQGFPGLVHGGIVTAMLDEIMAHAVWAEGAFAVTGRLEVFFRQPTPIDTVLRAVGEVVDRRERVFETRGRLLLPDGRVCAEASGSFVLLPEGRFGRDAAR